MDLVTGWSISEAARRAALIAFSHRVIGFWLPAAVCSAALAGILALRVAELGRNERRDSLVVAALAFLALLSLRWPILGVFELNLDESFALTGARTLSHDPIYWRSVDGATHGPLVAFALVPARVFGVAFDYGWARLIGLVMMCGALLSLYGILRRLGDEAAAALMLLGGVVCIGSLPLGDLVAYDAEHPALLLLSLSGYSMTRMIRASRGAGAWAFATGVLAAMVPLAKLQAVPIAACIGFVAAAVAVKRAAGPADRTVFPIAGLLSGALLPCAALTLYLWRTHLFAVFWYSYVVLNISYVNGFGFGLDSFGNWHGFLTLLARPVLREALLPCLVVWDIGALAILIVLRKRVRPEDRDVLGFAVTVVAAAVYAIYQPGRPFDHYILLLLIPAIFLAGALLSAGFHTFTSATARRRFAAAYVVLCIAAPLVRLPTLRSEVFRNVAKATTWPGVSVARVVRTYAAEGEPMVVWGWMERYHVLAGMPQATARANPSNWITQFPIEQARFFAQLQAATPPVFIDAVGPGAFRYSDRTLWSHEQYPWLLEWLAPRYQLVAEVEGARVYVSNERLAAHHASARSTSHGWRSHSPMMRLASRAWR